MSDGFSDGVTTPGQKVETPTEANAEKNYVEELVGDGKKFSSVEDAINALAKKAEHADTFIETLKTEKQQVEQQYQDLTTKSKTVDEIVELLKPPPATTPPVVPLNESQAQKSPALTIEEVKQYLAQEKIKTAQQEAADKLWNRLSSEDVFGSREKANEVVTKYIGNDPVRKALVDQMAVSDPTGLEMLLKSTAPKSENVNFMDNTSDKATEESVFQPQGTLTWDVVKRVKKENPKLYNSKAFKNRMHSELPRD